MTQNNDYYPLSRESIILFATGTMGYSTNILSRRIVPRIYHPVGYPVLNFILYLLKDMKSGSLLSILYLSIISLRMGYSTRYSISFRPVVLTRLRNPPRTRLNPEIRRVTPPRCEAYIITIASFRYLFVTLNIFKYRIINYFLTKDQRD